MNAYLALLEQKTRALDQAAPLAGWKLPDCFADLRRLLEARLTKHGSREYVLSSMQRNFSAGPGFADIDISGEKETKLFEGISFFLRADAFDTLNHPNFGQLLSNVQSSSFGQITAKRFATSDGGSSGQLQLSAKILC